MPLRIWRILTLLGRPPGLAGGINGSRMAHSASERSLAYGFIGEDLLTFHFFCLDLLLLYHISPSRLLLFKRLPWPFRTAFSFSSVILQGGIPLCYCLADLVRRIFLDEVQTAHAHLGLIGEAAVERALLHRNGPRLRIDEELGNRTGSKPCSARPHDLHHIGGLACNGQLPRPAEGRAPPFARFPVGATILFHLGSSELT